LFFEQGFPEVATYFNFECIAGYLTRNLFQFRKYVTGCVTYNAFEKLHFLSIDSIIVKWLKMVVVCLCVRVSKCGSEGCRCERWRCWVKGVKGKMGLKKLKG